MVQVKDLLGFFNPGFNRLPAVVPCEPDRQITGHGFSAEMKQGAVLEGLAGVKGSSATSRAYGHLDSCKLCQATNSALAPTRVQVGCSPANFLR